MVDPLPAWVDPDRLHGQEAIANDIVDRFRGRNGHPQHDVVFLQAPTGVGKTLIAELVRRKMKAKTIYSCTTKALQEQFVKDFPYAKVLKGRSNYLTELGMVSELRERVDDIRDAVTAVDCTYTADYGCNWCEDRFRCEYLRARGTATSAQLAVLNSAYLLTDANGPRRFTYRDLYVMDEADVLEGQLLNHAELHITNYRMRKLGITPPKYKTKDDTWAEWIKEVALPKAQDYFNLLPELQDTTRVQDIREYKYMERLVESLVKVMGQLPNGKWVHDGYSERNYDNGDVIFRPVFVAGYGNALLWRNGTKFLLMSATILTDTIMAAELGLTLDTRIFSTVEVPSNFPIENRPVHVVPIAEMTYTKMEDEKPKMADAICGVLRRHPDERVLVHCVSYDLARYLEGRVNDLRGNGIGGPGRLLLTYNSSHEKDAVLDTYKATDGAVLFAASMDRGIDLPDNACRVQVVAKVPYPNLKDKRINARLHSPMGQHWYIMQTVRTLVQMAGRAVRHKGDYAVTYILDSQFVENVWKGHSKMFPKYFREALNFRFNPRLLKE